MEYNITLNAFTYLIFMCISGSLGSCHVAYETRGTTKPFAARALCGTVAGLVTMLIVYYLKLPPIPLIHAGVATFLGMLAEGEGLGRLLDAVIERILRIR